MTETFSTTAGSTGIIVFPGGRRSQPGESFIDLRSADVITPKAIEWLWHYFIALAKVMLLAGAPGTLKTTIALAFIATITRSGRWPDGTTAPTGECLIWSGEDSIEDTLVPRLMAAGADMSKVKFISRTFESEGPREFDPAIDVPILVADIEQRNLRPVLVLIDPIVSAVTGDGHTNTQTRRSLAPIVAMAERLNVAVLGITHFSKNTKGKDVLERINGSVAFGAMARLVLATAKVPEEEGGGYVLCRVKSNIGPDGGGFKYSYRVDPLATNPSIEASYVTWGECITGNARDILSAAEEAQEPERAQARAEAKDFLLDLLKDGPLPQSVIEHEANRENLSWSTVKRAKKALNIESHKQGNGPWSWYLPRHQTSKKIKEDQNISSQKYGPLGLLDSSQKKEDQEGQEFVTGNSGPLQKCQKCDGEGCSYCVK